MADVIISRRGNGGGSSTLITEYIESNRVWTVPSNAKGNKFSIRIIGSGGYTYGSGGSSGWMNNDVLTLTPGQSINVTIANQNGQTTSFGTYLSAAGGYTAQTSNVKAGGGSGGTGAATGYQFGGGGQGGNGGPWGGGGGGWFGGYGNGGHGGIYGGGGGGGSNPAQTATYGLGGNGGTYGGGGGGACTLNNMGNGGIGGTYGGNGGNSCNPKSNTPPTIGENGTNTIGWTNLMKFDDGSSMTTGNGKSGSLRNSFVKWGGGTGGGGFGGIGGDSWLPSAVVNNKANHGGGGGGGYGSNGGTGGLYNAGGGGGGGYGGDGGTADINVKGGGGGGGYGKISKGGSGGGGGYYCPAGGFNNISGCGGGLGILSNDGVLIKSYGSGGTVASNSSSTATLKMQPEPGVCIIQYTLK